MSEELKFPIEFKACPHCGSEETVAQALKAELVAAGKMGEAMKCCITQSITPFFDPSKINIAVPVVVAYYDICKKCGAYYAVRIEKQMGYPQGPVPSGGPGKYTGGFSLS